jgi:hypothetical protein
MALRDSVSSAHFEVRSMLTANRIDVLIVNRPALRARPD